MIKKIQLRGISRNPSDRLTADGGCAESLNVRLLSEELAPLFSPEQVTRYSLTTITGRYVFIHKGNGYENVLYVSNSNGNLYALPRDGASGTTLSVLTLGSYETLKDITAIGNTLVVATSQRKTYVLFKDGAYVVLGERVPVPDVNFRSYRYDHYGLYDTKVHEWVSGSSDYDRIFDWEEESWKSVISERFTYRDELYGVEKLQSSASVVNMTIWDVIKEKERNIKSSGYTFTPLFARFAVKLYDGTYIYQSVPVLLNAGDESFVTVFGKVTSASTTHYSFVRTEFRKKFKDMAFIADTTIFEGWEDIVQSVDIFVSTDIHFPLLNATVSSVKESQNPPLGTRQYDITLGTYHEETPEIYTDDNELLEEVLSKSIFYKVGSFSIDGLQRLADGYDLLSDTKFASQDYLVTQKTLPDGFQEFHKRVAENLDRYNNRLLLSGLSTEVSPGYDFVNGLCVVADDVFIDNWPEDPTSNVKESWRYEFKYEFAFYLRGPGNETLIVRGRDADGHTVFTPYSYTATGVQRNYPTGNRDYYEDEPVSVTYYSRAYGWIAYPDARCYKVEVKVTKIAPDTTETTEYRSYEMRPHPLLACSYAFIGLQNEVGDEVAGEEIESLPVSENKTYLEKNVLWAAKIDNPFVLPLEGRMTFSAEVLAIGITTKPLSEGQHGQFPLMVFTGDGIWSVPVSSEGDFGAPSNMSRDVLLSRKSICSIEQAIVFVTNQGVMLLSEMDVTPLSPNMIGEHYKTDTAIGTALTGSDWAQLDVAYASSIDFLTFVKGASITYDYTNRRLLFLNGSYAYVYDLSTTTWHKFCFPDRDVSGVLNSYPECFVGFQYGQGSSLYNLSVTYNPSASSPQGTLPGVVVTRAMDFDLPDVRKTLKDVRIRGNYARGKVKYLLEGSFDGISWKRLTSLRGGSYKLFRFVILFSGLLPSERVSWIDVDFEPRYNNKFR